MGYFYSGGEGWESLFLMSLFEYYVKTENRDIMWLGYLVVIYQTSSSYLILKDTAT